MQSNNEVDICFLGDTYFGEWHMKRRVKNGFKDILKERGYLDFTKFFDQFLNKCDFVIANLECAITQRDEAYFAKEKIHTYAGKKDTLEALKKANISLVTMANNHAGDFGKEGLLDTIKALKEFNIDYVGGGKDLEEASKSYIYTNNKIPEFTMAILSSYNLNKKNESYGFYADKSSAGVNVLNLDSINKTFKENKNKNKNIFNVLVPHWGDNFIWRPNTNRNRALKLLNSEHCNLIIGHSAHMMQEVEYINSKLVLYSIGNFILNGGGLEYKKKNLPPYSFIVRLNISRKGEKIQKKLLLYPIMCDNSTTDFTPRFVSEKEFEHVYMILKSLKYDFDALDKQSTKRVDENGFYLEFNI